MTSDTPLNFSQLGLPARLCETLTRLGYEQPSSIQERSIPPLIEGKDLLGIAQTGTGKTAAFSLPLIATCDSASKQPDMLVLTPTRELCIQVAEAIESYSESIKGIRVLPIYGGQDMGQQIRQLKKGPQIIVGTPGRVMDHMRRKTLKLESIRSVVLDEADEMLRMGFIDDVEWILEHTPDSRQLALFSATMPSAIKRIATTYLKDPVEVRIEAATKTVDRIEQTYVEVNNQRKLIALELVLETEEFDAVIVFARTKTSAQELAKKLELKGYKASSIHGDLNQRQRELCIRQLKDSVIDIVVATDVAARGIDVPRVTHVVNYDIPYDGESYIHRIGRTGRAGRSGKAILFVTQRERRMLKTIERTTGQPVAKMALASPDELRQLRLNRLADGLAAVLQKPVKDNLRDSLKSIQEQTNLSYEDIALALCARSPEVRALAFSDNDISLSGGKRLRDDKGGKNSKRDDRGEGSKSKRSRDGKGRQNELENIPMDTYRLAVGSEHSVRVGDILGAVANELGIDSRYIGEIRLEKNNSEIDLPEDMPKELFQQFKKIRIRNYPAKPELRKGRDNRSDNVSDASPSSDKSRKPRKRKISEQSEFSESKPRKDKHSRPTGKHSKSDARNDGGKSKSKSKPKTKSKKPKSKKTSRKAF